MKIKVNYDPQTTLVKGYYPDSVNYSSIPEPFIEIENNQQINDRQMCVIDGVYQEYVKPLAQQLEEARNDKKAQCKAYLKETDWHFTAFLERQRAIPANVATNRANAVLWQNLSDKELDNLTINFI